MIMHFQIKADQDEDEVYIRKTISGGPRQAKRYLDSAVSSLLALISREYAQLV